MYDNSTKTKENEGVFFIILGSFVFKFHLEGWYFLIPSGKSAVNPRSVPN